MESTPHAGYPPDGTVFRDRVIEVLLITFLLLEVWFLYAPLGTLIAQRGVNKAPMLMTALDHAIPYVPEPVFAYRMAFVVVPIALTYFIVAWFRDDPQFRSMALAYFLILVLAFVIYWMFPVSILTHRTRPPGTDGAGLANEWVRATYATLSPWNSFPSMHIATGWFAVRGIWMLQKSPKVRLPVAIWFALMAVGTVTLFLHSLLDGLAGLALSEGCIRGCLARRDRISAWVDSIPTRTRLALLALGNGALVVLLWMALQRGLFERVKG